MGQGMRIPGDEARALFTRSRVARLATVDRASIPHLVPVTFAVIDGPGAASSSEVIVFAVDHKPKSTTALRRLENIAANPRVCFLVDHYDDNWEQLWWVRADAEAGVLQGSVRDNAVSALVAKYPQYREHPPGGTVVGSAVVRWSGWRAASQ